jgi:uncharacterized cupredoxin-like copper-binding protein
MRRKFTAALATFAFAALAAPAAHAEEIVPPGNSAVIQYTETIPSAGGQKDAEAKQGKAKPGEVLGDSTTRKLEAKGKTGEEVADFAAETAPVTTSGKQQSSAQSGEESTGGKKQEHRGGTAPPQSNGGNGGGGGDQAGADLGTAEGSSALGQIAAQATGTSSGELGLLLPLLILAAAGWAGAYYWRKRHRIA